MKTTHTYVVLELTPLAFNEIKAKLEAADYRHAFDEVDGRLVIDLHGIAVAAEPGLPVEVLPPEVLYFGCESESRPGHHLRSKRRGMLRYDSTPWRNQIDGGLIASPDNSPPDGRIHHHQLDGWSAVAFWDRSGDSRGNSNSAFFVAQLMTADELISLARQQWPEVFSRRNFPVLKLVK